jgi:hypothetical protein
MPGVMHESEMKIAEEKAALEARAKEKGVNLRGPTRADAERLVLMNEENKANQKAIDMEDQKRSEFYKTLNALNDDTAQIGLFGEELFRAQIKAKGFSEGMVDALAAAHAIKEAKQKEETLQKERGEKVAKEFTDQWNASQAALEGLKTPMEHMGDKLKEAQKWLEQGMISEQDFRTIASKAGEDLTPKYQGVGAVVAGSSQDFSTRARLMFEGNTKNPGDIAAQQLLEAREQKKKQEDANVLLKQIADHLANPDDGDVVDFF